MNGGIYRKIQIPYGSNFKEFEVPRNNLVWMVSPSNVPPVEDEQKEILRAIRNPLGMPNLSQMVAQKGKNTVILVDDNTRITPQKKILPLLLDDLNKVGVKDKDITVIIAVGTHRFMSREEITERLGALVTKRVKVINHPYNQPDELVNLGRTPRGVPISVNKRYIKSNISIAVGNIVPHMYAGWAGGGKMIQPGISGPQTTSATHLLAAKLCQRILGQIDNPVRREIDEVAIKSGLTMIVNTILNEKGNIVKVVAGDVFKAHREGVRVAKRIYTAEIKEYPDIVIASSYPADRDLWQGFKALNTAALAVGEGGTVILVSPYSEGLSPDHPILVKLGTTPVSEVEKMIGKRKIEDRIGAATYIAMALSRKRAKVVIVTEGISEGELGQIGFLCSSSIEYAIENAFQKHGLNAKIGVITQAADMAIKR